MTAEQAGRQWKTLAPLFRDPVYDGCSDPTVVYNQEENSWWMFYTQRRASLPVVGVSGSFGTEVGIASSPDGGKTWVYRGTAQGLSIDWGHNTFWAPEVFFDKKAGLYRMIVTYTQGVPHRWGLCGGKCGMVHYTSRNLYEWKYCNFVFGRQHSDIIDACVFPLPQGGYRMWYRDTALGCSILFSDTQDFVQFTEPRTAVEDHSEGPNVFSLGGHYWLLTDSLGKRSGLTVYRSTDLLHWEWQPEKLLAAPGSRPLDDSPGRHADVVTVGNDAYIYYFTQPWRDYSKPADFTAVQDRQAVCVIQCARIYCENGVLRCDRDEDFDVLLPFGRESGVEGQ